MDEKRIMDLVKAAAEREELEAALGDGAGGAPAEAKGRRSAKRWMKIGGPLLAVAAVVVILLVPRSVAIEEITVRRAAVRATNGDFEVVVTLNRPGFLRVVVVDEGNERWIYPIRERSEYVAKVSERTVFLFPALPAREGVGPGAPRYLLIIASDGVAPTADDLLRDIPDPVAPPGAPTAAVRSALEDVGKKLMEGYPCAAEVLALSG